MKRSMTIPPELMLESLSFLSALDLIKSVSPVCSTWNALVNSILKNRLLQLTRHNHKNGVRIVFEFHVFSNHLTYSHDLSLSHFLSSSQALFLFPTTASSTSTSTSTSTSIEPSISSETTSPLSLLVPLDDEAYFATVHFNLCLKSGEKNEGDGGRTTSMNPLRMAPRDSLLTPNEVGRPRMRYQIDVAGGHERIWKSWWKDRIEDEVKVSNEIEGLGDKGPKRDSNIRLTLPSLRSNMTLNFKSTFSIGTLNMKILDSVDLGGGEKGYRLCFETITIEVARVVVGLEMEWKRRSRAIGDLAMVYLG